MAPCPDQLADLAGSAEPLFETVVEALASLPSCCSRLWIAVSGGCDSITLLHCAARALRVRQAFASSSNAPELHALHVNHQLQEAAGDFEQLCRTACASWGIALHVESVSINMHADGGLEARAREARYAVFTRILAQGDVLWMAHHADDQAETVLQRAMRGSGTKGMSGMPEQRPLGQGQLMRPLLRYRRQSIEAYALRHKLRWSEDPSNTSLHFDRNYLRHRIIPCLCERWPQAVSALGQVAEHAHEADELLNLMADRQLAQWPDAPRRLPIEALQRMAASEVRLVIRRALTLLNIPAPPRARLQTVLAQLAAGKGHIHWLGGEIRLWQGTLYLAPCSSNLVVRADGIIRARSIWHIVPLNAAAADPVRFTVRQGGERLRVNGCRRTVKALFQARRTPPWERDGFCIAWSGEVPVALVSEDDIIVADGWQARRKQSDGSNE